MQFIIRRAQSTGLSGVMRMPEIHVRRTQIATVPGVAPATAADASTTSVA